jgi:hypothetical protein
MKYLKNRFEYSALGRRLQTCFSQVKTYDSVIEDATLAKYRQQELVRMKAMYKQLKKTKLRVCEHLLLKQVERYLAKEKLKAVNNEVNECNVETTN